MLFARLIIIVLLVANTATAAQQQPAPPSAKEQAAAKLLAASDWPAALTAYRELATLEPQNPRAAFGLGAALHETGRPADALEPLLRAKTLGYVPLNQVRFRLARAYAKSGDTANALAMLDELVANNFSNTAATQTPDLQSLPADRLAAFVKAVNDRARPCAADPNYRKFDFWIGVWDVQPTGAPRAPSGATSRIERQLDEQYWADTSGNITHYIGEFRDDGNLYYEADQFGTGSKLRMTFFNQGPNQVRQLGHTSTDGGKTWTVSYDLTYIRKS
jgi:tetratricopeptide (TPR) repeat protein